MKEIWFIRHGESESNAGLATTDPATIPLTTKGHIQAKALAEKITGRPGLIVMTAYLRTQQTAKPLMEMYPDVPAAIWPLHEFDFLSPGPCSGTTVHERKPWVEAYWNRCEPTYVHGKDAESFMEFKSRVIDATKQLQARPEEFILVFAHGHVIRAIWQYLQTRNENINDQTMRYFRDKMSQLKVENTAIFKSELINDEWVAIDPVFQTDNRYQSLS